MKYNKIFLISIFILFISFANAQNSGRMDEKGRLAIGVWVPDQIEELPAAAKNSLENKLSQIIVANGLGDGRANSRFILSANVAVLTKDITPTAPPMHVYTLDLTLYIGDGLVGKAFSSYSTTVKGVGENETKAYMSALKNINTNNQSFQSFIDNGKAKIIEYFNAQCDINIKEARVLAGMNQFDKAIWLLTSIPDVCTDCWNKSMAVTAQIFQQKIDFECKIKLTQATNVWNAGQNWDAAEQAGAILSTIDPNSSCYNGAKALGDKISKRILAVDKREWNFAWEKEIGLTRDMIKAYRDIGVAWGNGQAKSIIYKSLW